MSDENIKTMVYIIAAILSIYPLIELFKKNKKAWARVIIILFLMVFWPLTCRYKKIIDKEISEAKTSAKTSDSLNKEANKKVDTLRAKIDSSNSYLKKIMTDKNVPDSTKKVINNFINNVNTLNQ